MSARRLSRGRIVAAVALTLAAQAFADAPVEPPRHASLFISPAGEPFHATAAAPDPVAQWFAKVDRKGEGRIDRAAFRADATAFFQRLDLNHDGVIDDFEVQTYEEQVAPEILGAYRADQGGGGHGRRAGAGGDSAAVVDGAPPYELLPIPEPVAAADLSTDGRITLAEFLTVADRRFDELDTKHLGYLTLATLPKTPAELDAAKAKRKPPRPDSQDH